MYIQILKHNKSFFNQIEKKTVNFDTEVLKFEILH